MIETRLIAGDAGIDDGSIVRSGLADPLRVRQERPRHRHHVGMALGQHRLGNLGHVDAIGGDQRQAELLLHALGQPREDSARHAGDDGRHTRLMPADAGIDQARPCRLDGLAERDHFLPGAALIDQIQHREAIDDQEVLTQRGANAGDDLHRQADAILEAATILILALIGAPTDELVDEIAFRAHHLDAVIAGLAGQAGAAHVVGDLLLDL